MYISGTVAGTHPAFAAICRHLPAGSDVNLSGSEPGFTRARGQDDVSKHKANSLKLHIINYKLRTINPPAPRRGSHRRVGLHVQSVQSVQCVQFCI